MNITKNAHHGTSGEGWELLLDIRREDIRKRRYILVGRSIFASLSDDTWEQVEYIKTLTHVKAGDSVTATTKGLSILGIPMRVPHNNDTLVLNNEVLNKWITSADITNVLWDLYSKQIGTILKPRNEESFIRDLVSSAILNVDFEHQQEKIIRVSRYGANRKIIATKGLYDMALSEGFTPDSDTKENPLAVINNYIKNLN